MKLKFNMNIISNSPYLPMVQQFIRNKKLSIPTAAVVLILLLLLVFSSGGGESIPTSEARKGPFLVSIKSSGEIRAANSFTMTTPRLTWGQMQIVYLIPEGTIVKKGDVVIRFASTTIDKTIQDKESELNILKSELTKFRADREVRLAELEGNLKNSELSFEQAKLQVEKMKFEAEVQRKETEINLQRGKIAYEQAQRKIESQKVVEQSEERKQVLKIKQVEADLTRAKADKEEYTLKATMDGLTVYEMNWQTGRKISVGDSPWPGMPLVSLPDLAKMQSVTQINEVDISKVSKSQAVKVKLDAFPEREFKGTVQAVGTIGQQNDRTATLKTFEVVIDIEGTDPVLKPGMTTSNEIIMATLADTLFIPLESVFEKDGKTIVYRMSGSSARPVEVKIGTKNTNFVVVTEGLEAGDKVTLRDPTIQQDDRTGGQKQSSGTKL